MSEPGSQPDLPQAELRPKRRPSAVWLIPLLTVAFAAWLAYQSWSMRGVVITVHLDEGHGLAPGDDIRYRGIAVGAVQSVDLAPDLAGVVVTASLRKQGMRLARVGSRFWVVRPRVGVTGVEGLETLVGPRYLAMLPGDGRSQRHFVGLSEAPMVESTDPGDLEIVLMADRRSGVQVGAPVLYRQVPVGKILSVGLTSDATRVEARAHIYKAYTQLIRPETRFWNVGGVDAQLSLRGMTINVESVAALLAGGVALATPRGAGAPVRNGHRFRLYEKAEEDWLQWEPLVAIGHRLLPPGAVMPSPVRAVLTWQGGWLKRDYRRRGWVMRMEDGLVGPGDLLHPDPGERPESAVLEVAGEPIPLPDEPAWTDGALARLAATVEAPVWPAARIRAASAAEDCLAVADPGAAPLPLSATRMTVTEGAWRIDPAVSLDGNWHGAAVVARSDGALIGLVVVDDDGARVALLSEEFIADTPLSSPEP